MKAWIRPYNISSIAMQIAAFVVVNISGHLFAQDPDSLNPHQFKPIVVTSYIEQDYHKTALNISAIDVDSLNNFGNYNLTDLIAKTPGVSILSTGVAISKPIIRGLYGNRTMILLSGLRFDNQQWQEEHGLGLSDIGLSTVEIIKGPMSVLYGSEAMGGIINLIEEGKSPLGLYQTDFSMRFNSNTLGGLVQGGYKANYGNHWTRIRIGLENNADYSDGNNNRVLNSRADGYYFKGTYGFKKDNWISTNNVLSSFNRSGFIFTDVYTYIEPDNRWSRRLNENPAHLVLLNIFSSENKFLLPNKSKLNLNFGIQSNERMENEGGGAISLNMHLLTVQYLLKWEMQVSEKNRLILSNLGSYENNTNFGARKIVPDADLQESNFSVFLESVLNEKVIFENGGGIGEKWIRTKLTPTVNSSDKEIDPFSKFSPYYNFFSGITLLPARWFNFKVNIASGIRVANLAELSSDGLHEGIFTFEIGDPDLKNEQNFALNMLINFETKWMRLCLTPFYNRFQNYIYLAPTNESWFGFPVYRYFQQHARQYGTEISLLLHPTKHLSVQSSYSGMTSLLDNGDYTPYIPAQRIVSTISYGHALNENWNFSVMTEADYRFAQDQAAPFELTTSEYWLFNAALSFKKTGNGTNYSISVAANNLLNEAYYDHLSRFKYYGLLNTGRNITVNFKMYLNGSLKNQ